jgi:catechol 2,3-dioxygenase-like lactoylglutathione lyase family enzyme/predicted N-acetyltransferase YhbS
MQAGEEDAVCQLITRVFDEFVAPDFGEDGIQEFYRYANPESLAQHAKRDHDILVAEEEGQIVGMIAMRKQTHVALLFVERRGRGIARELLRQAMDACRQAAPETTRITVHSSPYALPVYLRLGFEVSGPEKTVHGIRFVPMHLRLDRATDTLDLEEQMNAPFPAPGMELTHILVVGDINRSRTFYCDVLGATLYREYGGTSCVLQFLGAWLLLVTGGGPTADKPDTEFETPLDPSKVSHAMTIRVPDCKAGYETLKARGAEFLTPPYDWGGEIRCFFRDPDGHLLEISESVEASTKA